MNELINNIIQKYTKNNFLPLKWSACNKDGSEIIEYFMKKEQIKNALEIGTYQGVTTALMSQFAEKVYTIDCVDYKFKYELWNDLDIQNIKSFIFIPDSTSKVKIIDELDFDFAFIDGGHGLDVLLDYLLCRKCGRLLFHDYSEHPNFIWVKLTVDMLPKDEIEFYSGEHSMFAYWRQK